MAALYLDQNVAIATQRTLHTLGHQVTTVRDAGLDDADDDFHLFHASQFGWILVTHNREDFELLHSAWRRWSARCLEWSPHAGILVHPQPPVWTTDEVAHAVHQFLRRDLPLADELYSARGRADNPRWYRWILDAHRGQWVPSLA